jgi:PleD family two-component response regulator
MSFGVAGPEGHSLESLFAAADQALYVAKRKGRNRVEAASVPGSGSVSVAG